MSSTTGVNLSISGLASGFDWKSVVTQLATAERSAETPWKRSQIKINGKNQAFSNISSYLTQLQTDVQKLKDPTLYAAATATASDTTKASASATSVATPGTYAFNISNLATAAQIAGAANVGKKISANGDLSAVTVGNAGFAAPVAAGTFTINGKQITIATTDTLQQVFNNIATATNNNVTASYSTTTDKFTLATADGSQLILGSAADTSNFLQVSQLYNNNTSTSTSATALGHVIPNIAMYDSSAQLAARVASGFTTPVTAGTFTINGAKVTVGANDSLQTVFNNIATATNNAVTASYNAASDKINLTSTLTGQPITLGSSSDTSNFLQVGQLASNSSGLVVSNAAVGGTNAGITHTGLTTPITGDGSTVGQLQTQVAAGFGTAIGSGTFTINGATVTIGANDTLQTVFNNIATATNNKVTASYDSGTDKITFASADNITPITLGASGDTSNFLSATGLTANSTSTVTSATRLGGVQAQGALSVNGVIVNYNVGLDSIQNILDRITNSAAGVTASYDAQNNRFLLTNKNTGDVGIGVQDVNGNFAAATGLTGSPLIHGTNLNYTLNGNNLVSQSNTITSASSNLNGLTVNAIATGAFNVTVGSDTSGLTTAIQSFITDYNTVQNYIGAQTASTTDSTGNVTAGILASDPDANGIISTLRSLSFAPVPGLTGTVDQLAKLGIQTNGQNNSILLSDPTALATALSTNLNAVKTLFSDATNGVAVKLDTYLTNTIGPNGSIPQHQASLTKQSTSIDAQIANQEKLITSDSAQWTKAFQAMETAQAAINQQQTYLTQAVSNGTL